jgi:PAS domain-containing protein
MLLYAFLETSIFPSYHLSNTENFFSFYINAVTIGCIGFAFAFFVVLKQAREEKKYALRFLEILNTSSQEWFYFKISSQKGVASEGLNLYLGWDGPLETFEDFAGALQRKFSFDIKSFIQAPFKNIEDFKVDISHPENEESCELKVAWGIEPQSQHHLIFLLKDTKSFTQELNRQQQKLTSVIEENTRLKETLDILPFPIWFRNTQGWVTYCNRFYAEALDTSNEYITQENTLLWVEGESRWQEDIKHIKNLRSLVEPLKRHILIQGERRYFEFKEETLNSLGGMIGYGTDLTDVEKALIDLEQHNMAYRQVLETLSAGVTIYGPDKKLQFFNHAYARLFEIDEKWLHTSPSLGEILDDVRQRRLLSEQSDYHNFRKQQLQMVSSLVSPFQQLEHLPDGRTIRRITAPHPLGGVFFIFEDVTNALSLEQQYNTQLAVHRASLDNLYEGVAVFGSDNRLKLINPAFLRIWKIDKDKMKTGQHISESMDMLKKAFISKDSWEDYKARLISEVTDRLPKKLRLECRGNKIIDFNYVPLPDGSHLLTCMDVSDSYRVERLLDPNKDIKQAFSAV